MNQRKDALVFISHFLVSLILCLQDSACVKHSVRHLQTLNVFAHSVMVSSHTLVKVKPKSNF